MDTQTRQKLLHLLIDEEGVRLRPYRDSLGYLTIGIGRCLDTKGITNDEALYLCNNDITECMINLSRKLDFFANLDYVRQSALIDLCFNLGFEGVLQFKKMLIAMEKKDWATAKIELFNSQYPSQVGNRANEIGIMIEKGVWPI